MTGKYKKGRQEKHVPKNMHRQNGNFTVTNSIHTYRIHTYRVLFLLLAFSPGWRNSWRSRLQWSILFPAGQIPAEGPRKHHIALATETCKSRYLPAQRCSRRPLAAEIPTALKSTPCPLLGHGRKRHGWNTASLVTDYLSGSIMLRPYILELKWDIISEKEKKTCS